MNKPPPPFFFSFSLDILYLKDFTARDATPLDYKHRLRVGRKKTEGGEEFKIYVCCCSIIFIKLIYSEYKREDERLRQELRGDTKKKWIKFKSIHPIEEKKKRHTIYNHTHT